MIHIRQMNGDGVLRKVEDPKSISDLLKAQETLLWVDAEAPSHDDLAWVKKQFHVHPIAMEDYSATQDRARIDRFHQLYSMVFFALGFNEETGEVLHRPITLYIAPKFIVTLHAELFPEVKAAQDLWERHAPEMPREIGVALWALLDTLVDDYFPVVDHLADEVEEVEDLALQPSQATNLDRIFRVKRQLLYLRRSVAPERDVLNVLLRRELPLYSENTQLYFQDVYDHLVRVLDSLDIHRDLLSGALDLYVSVASNQLATSANRLNATMQTLTSWSIILMSAALISGIYGMNFRDMPELNWRYGYPAALGTMVIVGGALSAYFKRRKWL